MPSMNYRYRNFTAIVIAGALVVFVSFAVLLFFWMQKAVTIIDDGNIMQVKTMKTTAAGALEQAEISLLPGDTVEPSLDARLKDGMIIEINRAFPVYITCDGKRTKVISGQNSVMQVLQDNHVNIGPKDKVEPGLEQVVTAGAEIRVVRVTEELVTETKRIYYNLVKKNNDKLEKGVTKVVQQGSEGEKLLTYRVTYEDGEEVSREMVGEKVIKEKQDKIVEYGTIDSFVTARGDRIRFSKALTMMATAYHAGVESTGKTPDHPEYGITYTGVRVQKGIVAVDPKVIPLGTRLYVEGYGYAVAADIGSAIKGNRIDLYHDTYEEAMRYGRRRVKVYFLTE
jgi:uncharacterized protein YabE (DUF348 family)